MPSSDIFTHVGLTHYLVLSAVVFSIGIAGVLLRRNAPKRPLYCGLEKELPEGLSELMFAGALNLRRVRLVRAPGAAAGQDAMPVHADADRRGTRRPDTSRVSSGSGHRDSFVVGSPAAGGHE